MMWYERAVQTLEKEYDEGLLTDKEFGMALRELDDEVEEGARMAAEEAYENYYGEGGW